MKRFIKAALVVGLIATLFIVLTSGGSAAPPGQPFIGAWKSTDADGSNQTLWIRRGKGGYYVDLFDDRATVACPLDPPVANQGYPLIEMGTGKPARNDFVADVEMWCLADPAFWRSSPTRVYTYDPSTDKLTQYQSIVWDRVPTP